MSEKIIIKKNPNGDTRTAPKDITFEQFQAANDSHRSDVKRVMAELAFRLMNIGENHDWSKKGELEKKFYTDFCNTMDGNLNFIEGDWWKEHVASERHHLLANCPDDVNLLDVIEMVVDCTCAGLARSGEVRPMEITDEILHKAMNNTSKLICDMVDVEN